ncbi:Cna B domain protein [Actinobacteria bacterium OK074]|nr:Cna B domain protein [Actinobacteria bacterium OK074]
MKRRTPGGVGLTLVMATALLMGAATQAVPAAYTDTALRGTSTADGKAPAAPATGTTGTTGVTDAKAHRKPRGTGDGTVTVRVVTEVDADGTYDSVLEPGMPGVKVTLTDDAGHTLTSTTTDDGTAVFTPATSDLTGGKYRIQVVNPDANTYRPAVAGLATGADAMRSNTGFVDVSGATDVTYTTGFWDPGVYCQENPTLVTCNLAKGDATGKNGLVSFGGDFTNTSPGGTFTNLTANTAQQSVFGIGTDRTGNTYMGTLVKRHAEYGPAGAVNAIYRYNTTSQAVSTFVTLPGTLTAHDSADSYLNDDAVYSKVGREGIGDVDVSGDGKTLYAVDLNDSKLYTVPIQGTGDTVTAGTQTAYDIPKPADCVGDWHPYGIGVRGARVLVGGVCGAETTVSTTVPWGDPSQLSAHVYEFAAGAFSEIFNQKLDYPRGCAYRFLGTPTTAYRCTDTTTVGERMSALWEAWNERVPDIESHRFVSAPQPILSNIEIADNGDLVLGYRDRFGDMQGNGTYRFGTTTVLASVIAAGDVLRACVSGTTYTLENNGSCGSLTGNLPGNAMGPGNGEFYDDLTVLGDAHHDQITQGGTVLQPYRKKLWSTVYDPYTNQAFEQGVRRWTSEDGAIAGNLTFGSSLDTSLFGKGNGLADLELVCDQAPVQIGNRVWYDANGNGVQDPSEPPVAGVVVTLTDTNGRTLTARTDANGEYYLGTADGLKPNTSYEAAFDYSNVDPAGLPGSPTLASLKWTKTAVGSDRTIDSNVDATGKTTVDVGDPGTVDHTIDAGLVGPVNKLGDYVWYDNNENGIQDADEKPAPGVTVNLVDPATDTVIKTATTDDKGTYLFDQLPDGAYKVCFVKPDGYVFTKQNAGADGDDSVVDPTTGCTDSVTLGPDKREDLTLDAGLVPLNKVGDYVWYDTNGDGIQDPTEKPAPGVTVNLVDPATDTVLKTVKTDDAGKYLFADLADGDYKVCFVKPDGYAFTKQNAGADGDDSVVDPTTGCTDSVTLGPDKREDLTLDAGLEPLNKLGDFVWYDENGDGIQDADEKPAPGVTVNLVDPATDKVLDTTKTDDKGTYLFADLANGDYKICVEKPDGYAFTKQNAGAAGDDSVVDPTTGCSDSVTLGPDKREDLTLDAGLEPLNKLGDFVWYDANGDGIQDKGEKPADGVDVKLVDPDSGRTLMETSTDEDGKYLFTDLPNGTYKVCFTAPHGYLWTKQEAGGNGDDSVVDPATGCSPVIELGPGNRDVLTADAGLVKALALSLLKSDAKSHRPLGGAVFQLWRDSNGTAGLQQTGTAKDTLVTDCVTDRRGQCHFDELPIGTYYLVEKDVPEGYLLPKQPVTGPYTLTLDNAAGKGGLLVKLVNKRGEPCKGKKC